MKRTPLLLLLAAVTLFGLRMRLQSPGDLVAGVAPVAAGSTEGEEDAWRLRLFEVAHSSGSVPREDRFLSAHSPRPVPWPPLFLSSLAGLARRVEPPAQPDEIPARVDRRALLALLERTLGASGALAILAVFACARALHGGRAADVAGLAAAALYALLPSIVFAERAGRMDPHAWSAILACGQFGGVALALRAREEIDATLGGLLAGVASGLGLACDVGAVSVALAAAAALGMHALRARRDVRRALVLFVVSAAVVATMPWHLPSAAELIPARRGWGSGELFERLRYWPAAALLPAAFVTLASAPRALERTPLLLLALAALAWALAVDPGAACVHVACVLSAGVACADRFEAAAERLRALPIGVLVLVASPALLFVRSARFAPGEAELEARREIALELREVSAGLAPPVPWNHPTARPDWCVLTAPSFGASVAFGTRLPVLGATLSGVRADEASRAAARAAAALLAETDEDTIRRELRAHDVGLVVLHEGMARDPLLAAALEGGTGASLFERLSSPAGPAPAGFERLRPPSDDARLVVWRVLSGADEGSGEPPVMRSR